VDWQLRCLTGLTEVSAFCLPQPTISKLVVIALPDVGNGRLTDNEEKKILLLLAKEKPEDLKHDIRLAPRWIGEIKAKALK